MSCCNSKDCNCHQNSSFTFGLIFGLIIGAIIAVVIYKNNKQKVFTDLKKKLEKFFDVFSTPSFSKKAPKKNHSAPLKSSKISITLPPAIIKKDLEAKNILKKSKPRTFKK